MSFAIDLSVWLDDGRQIHQVDLFGQVLESIAVPKHLSGIEKSPPKRFNHLRVHRGSSLTTVHDETLDTNEVTPVLEKLITYDTSDIHYEVASAYDYIGYTEGPQQAQPVVGPLDIHYFGPDYDWHGHYYKRFGPIRIAFFNTKAFRVPEVLTNKIKRAVNERRDAIADLQIVAQFSHNFDVVHVLAKALIKKLNPRHLIVCTEAEIHPLTAHAIYHRNFQDFLADLQSIARLHELGGAYYCEVSNDDPAFIPPRKVKSEYGYLRRWQGSQEGFCERLQPIVDAVIDCPERIESVSRQQIEECFYSLEEEKVDEVNDSYYLSSIDAPFAYTEEAYFRLFEIAYGTAREPDSKHYKM